MQATKLFYCYAHKDKLLREQLATQLAVLKREGLINEWSDQDIGAGREWQKEIEEHLNEADVILLLVSPDFVQSDYCYSKEMLRALERHLTGKARVIPIILRPVDWGNMPFGKLQALPTGAKPINTWRNRDEALLNVVQGVRRVIEEFLPVPDVCPYLGLENFTESDHQFFFGRDRDIDKLLRRLRGGSHFMAVLGPSGSGKSSLVHAGLIIRLKEGNIPGSAKWKFISSRPLIDPFAQLAEQGLVGTSNNLLERAQVWRNQHPEKEQRLVLVLDQFEELWTNCPELAQEFLAQLVELLQAPYHEYITIIVIMRDDFYQYSVRNGQFADLMEQGIVNISPQLKQEEFVDIIQKPASAVGLRFADGLVHAIVEDLGMVTTPVIITTSQGSEEEVVRFGPSTILPLLEFALKQLWEKRHNEELTLSAYIAIQGVSGALTQWAEITYVNHIEERLHPLARHIFTELVYLDEKQEHPKSRRRKTLNSLCPGGGNPNEVHQVVYQLAKDRLLITNRDKEGQEWVEIIHDVLLQEWKLLRSWIENDHRFLLWRQELEHQLQLWIATNPQDPEKRGQAKLLRDTDLTEAEKWLEERAANLGQEEQDFIRASRARETQEQQRWKKMSDKTLARQLATQAETLLDQQPDLLERSVLLAVEAVRRYLCVETYQALSRGLSLLHQVTYLSEHREVGYLTAPAHRGEVTAAQFSPDGRYLITVGEKGSSHLWDTATGKALAWVSHEANVGSSMVSPDERYVVGVSDEKTVEIKAPITGNQVFLLPHEKRVGGMAFSPDGHYMLTASVDGTSYLWDIATGQQRIAVASEAKLSITATSPNGRYEAKVHDDRFIEIRDIMSGGQTARLVHPHKVYDMIFSADGSLLATIVQFGYVLVWNLANVPLRASLVHPTGSLHFSVNVVKCSPCEYAVATVYGEEVSIWSAMDNRLLAQIDLIGKGSLLDSSPVGQYLLAFSPNGQRLVAACNDHCARVWDLSDLSNIRQLFLLPHKEGEVNAVAISPDSRYAATAGSDHTARIWDITSGTSVLLIATLTHEGLVNSVAFSVDGCYLATASDDGYARIWDFSTPTVTRPHCTFRHKGSVNLVAFSPKGNYVATTVQDGFHQIHIWNILGNSKVASMKYRGNTYSNTIWAVAFSPDEKLLASTEGSEVKVWNVETGDQLTSLPHEANMHDVAFSPDGNYLIVPAGPSVHIWRATSADLLGRIVHKDSVNAIAFSYDGRYLATASGDTARLWLWHPEDLIEEACRRVTRNLTLEEWQIYLNDEPYRNTCTIRIKLDINLLRWSKQERSDAVMRRATRAVTLAERTPGSIQQIIAGIEVRVQYVDVPHPDFPDSHGSFKVTHANTSAYFRGTISNTVQLIWDLCIEALNKVPEDKHKEIHDQLNMSDNTSEEESQSKSIQEIPKVTQSESDSGLLLTEQAKQAMLLAEKAARSFQHNYIGTEHLLLGLLDEPEGGAGKLLIELNVKSEKVRSTLEFIIGRGIYSVLSEFGLTLRPRTKQVLERASMEARRLNHQLLSTEHLLLGLVVEREGLGAGILESLGINLEEVRRKIITRMSQHSADQS